MSIISSHNRLLVSTTSNNDIPSTLNLQRLACGGLSAALAKTVVAPLNRLTIIMQIQGLSSLNKPSNGTSIAYPTLFNSLGIIYKNEGILSLWNGNLANIMRVIPNYGIRFVLNDIAREYVAKLYGLDPKETKHSLTHNQLLLAGALAAVVQITLTYSIEVVSTRLAVNGSLISPVKYDGITGCARHIIKNEGIKALYNGYPITLLAGIPYISLQMSCYEIFQRYFNQLFPSSSSSLSSSTSSNQNTTSGTKTSSSHHISTPAKLLAGACASLTAQTLTYPGDVLRRRMQVDGMGSGVYAYKGIYHAIKTIYKTEGIYAFFKGIKVNSLRIIPEGAFMFYFVDKVKHIIGIDKYDTN